MKFNENFDSTDSVPVSGTLGTNGLKYDCLFVESMMATCISCVCLLVPSIQFFIFIIC